MQVEGVCRCTTSFPPSNVTPANCVIVGAYYSIPYNAIVNQCWDLHREPCISLKSARSAIADALLPEKARLSTFRLRSKKYDRSSALLIWRRRALPKQRYILSCFSGSPLAGVANRVKEVRGCEGCSGRLGQDTGYLGRSSTFFLYATIWAITRIEIR